MKRERGRLARRVGFLWTSSLVAGMPALACLLFVSALGAAEMKMVVESDAPRSKLLTSHFGTYGPSKSIYRADWEVRFWFDPAANESGQAGLYSYFGLLGDFEIAVAYEWLTAPAPTKGYGISCGLAADADGKMLSLARAHRSDVGSHYVVTEGHLKGDKMEYAIVKELPTSARKGKLVMRREQAEVVCLAGDAEPLEELCRFPFGAGTVRKVRLFGDPGGVPNRLDAKLNQFVARAEEISGNVPLSEPGSRWGWWLAGAGAVVGALLVFRRIRSGCWFRTA